MRKNFVWEIAVLIFLTSPVIGCGSGAPQPPPPPKLSTANPVAREVVEWSDFAGHLQSPKIATVTARVSGVIDKALFVEGASVSEGDLLFIIDDRSFKAELTSAEANLARSVALQTQAEARFKRFDSLKGTKAISAEDFDEALATVLQAKANVGVSGAARDVAKLNLEWTRVTAPISGKISKRYVTEGNQITGGNGQATQLTLITSIDPMHSYAPIPENGFLKIKDLSAGTTQAPTPCSVKLQNESSYSHRGVIDFVDSRVDPLTGTVETRCVLPNAEGKLTSGLFSRVRIPTGKPYQAVLIPDSAVGTDQNSRFVWVVNKDEAVEYRAVTLGNQFGALRAISKGIAATDIVVLNGLQNLRPGTKITQDKINIDTKPVDELAAELNAERINLAKLAAHGSDDARAALTNFPLSNSPVGSK